MEENAKYELLKDDTIVINGTKLYRVRALKSFGNVKKGDIGGYIESSDNLSIHGEGWVYDEFWVSGNAWKDSNGRFYGEPLAFGVQTY